MGWHACGRVLLPLLIFATASASPLLRSIANHTRQSKVLSFLPFSDSLECKSDDGRRTGICQNPYECRLLEGSPKGQCALGFGVCCVYESSCGGTIAGRMGYFVNPGYPSALQPGSRESNEECRLKISKSSSEISQIRLDMVHFTLGQPNRRTGVCEQDQFLLKGNSNSRQLKLCGQNTGQHFYFDVEDMDNDIDVVIKLAKDHVNRFWDIRLTQIEFKNRAPAGCLQYFTDTSGVVQTMNFGDNGRHLADQDYNICIKQGENMCSVMYEPCDQNSFKIGPRITLNPQQGGGSSPGGFGPGAYSQQGGFGPGGFGPGGFGPGGLGQGGFGPGGFGPGGFGPGGGLPGGLGNPGGLPGGLGNAGPLSGALPEGGIPGAEAVEAAADDPVAADDADAVEGSGGGGGGGGLGFVDFFPSFFSRSMRENRQIRPQECDDRIVMPCDSEDLIPDNPKGPGICDLLHCGNSFCSLDDGIPGTAACRIESSTLPFNIAVHFGPGIREENPEDNLGMCLKYSQQLCS